MLENILRRIAHQETTPAKKSKLTTHRSLRWGIRVAIGFSALVLACAPATESKDGTSPKAVSLPLPYSILAPEPVAPIIPNPFPTTNDCENVDSKKLIVDSDGSGSRIQLYFNEETERPESGVILITLHPQRNSRDNSLYMSGIMGNWNIIVEFDSFSRSKLRISGIFGGSNDRSPRLTWRSETNPINFNEENTYSICWDRGVIERSRLNGTQLETSPIESMPTSEPRVPSLSEL